MKKTLLMAGVACMFAANANAEIRPYAGLDFNYSTFDYAYDIENAIEDDYQSVSFVAGAKFHRNFGAEVFYQHSGKEKNTYDEDKYTTAFQAYGVDFLGFLPLGCDGEVELIAGAGIGEYEMKVKMVGAGSDKEETLGYRLNVGAQYKIQFLTRKRLFRLQKAAADKRRPFSVPPLFPQTIGKRPFVLVFFAF